jgi:asparagine synthase (glutamine-hydrolysing)
MCGIVGVWNFDGGQVNQRSFDVFVDSLAHRGPDGRGTYIERKSGIALGHRLLAIQGLNGEGKQPRNLGRRYWITFNGEIFNFIALRDELKKLGHVFQTETDTEVVLVAYAQWGEDCLLHFNGMWAFAIWDSEEMKLFLSVDRFAVKSCVYIWTAAYFAFASELKAFSFLDRYKLEPNGEEIAHMLATGPAGTTSTWLKDVYRLPAGHFMTVSHGRPPVTKRWWNTLDHLVEPPQSKFARIEKFAELFSSSVEMRLAGNAKIAIPLSGGMDSSAIVGMVHAPAQQRPVDEYRCFFMKKHGALDEEKYALSMARHVGIVPITLQGEVALDTGTMQDIIYSYENFGVSSDGPTRLYRAIKNSGASVSLCGHGGDELLGGYSIYIENALQDALQGIPNPARLIDLALINRSLSVNSENFSFTQGWGNTRKRIRAALLERLGRPVVRQHGTGKLLPSIDESRTENFPEWFGALNKELYHDVHYGFLQGILRSFDYASMASGVESRTPFLDWRLVVYLFSLPSDTKIGGGYTKRILRSAMRGFLPDDVLWRKSKIGFIESNGYFFNPSIIVWMSDIFSSHAFQESGLWDGKQIAGAFRRWNSQGGKMYVLGNKLLRIAQAHYLMIRMADNHANLKTMIARADAP